MKRTNNEFQVSIKGVAPLLMHSGRTKDPLDDFTKEIKKVSSKRNKTDEDFETMAKLEWFASLYLNQDRRLIIPSENIEACIAKGAAKNKNGLKVKSGMIILENPGPLLEYNGSPTVEKLFEDKQFVNRNAVNVQRNSVIRTRPIFYEWGLTFTIHYDPKVIEKEEIMASITNAGRFNALGDWRPKYGRFEIVE